MRAIFLFLLLVSPLSAFADLFTGALCASLYYTSNHSVSSVIPSLPSSGEWFWVSDKGYPNCGSGVIVVFQSQALSLQTQFTTLQSEKTALQAQVNWLQTQLQTTYTQCPTNTSLSNQQSVICPSIWSFSGSYEDARQLGNTILGLFVIVFIVISIKKFFL